MTLWRCWNSKHILSLMYRYFEFGRFYNRLIFVVHIRNAVSLEQHRDLHFGKRLCSFAT